MRPAPAPDEPVVPAEPIRWGQLVRGLLAYARGLGAPGDVAEDLVQDAIEVAMRDPAWYDPGRGRLGTVLRVVLRHRFVDRFRAAGVHERATPALRLVDEPVRPDEALSTRSAADARAAFLAQLTADERAVFHAWLRQRRGEVDVAGAAGLVGLTPAAFEAAKKRLRRRSYSILAENGWTPDDLYDPPGGGR